MVNRWVRGDIIVRREVLGLTPIGWPEPRPLWFDKPWFAVPVYVVEDTDDALITYLPSGAEFGQFDGPWPTPDGKHPWSKRDSWEGHGTLMIQKPGEHHAIWHFWNGPQRAFAGWYINLQTAFERTPLGYDTQDLELDIVIDTDGTWIFKDRELLPERIAEGRYSPEIVEWIVTLGDDLAARLGSQQHWWDHAWSEWTPDPDWTNTTLPTGWQTF